MKHVPRFKVWVLFAFLAEFDGQGVFGIFTTKQLADEALIGLNRDRGWSVACMHTVETMINEINNSPEGL